MLLKVCHIPHRIVKGIVRGDFMEMEELQPKLWPAAHEEGEGKLKKNWKITDIQMDSMFHIT